MKLFSGILSSLRWLGRVFVHEWSVVFHDAGALIFFFALPLAYPIVYTLIYNPEVVTDMPVAVVDNCRSTQSRNLVREADATSAIDIAGYASDMEEARRWMAEGKVFAIMEIPEDFSKDISSGRQTNVQFYCDMSLLLRYRAFLSALTDLQMQQASEITLMRVEAMGADGVVTSLPVNTDAHFLGDTQQGFASFVMPGIVVLILQQSMLLGICLLGGTANERRRRNHGYDPMAVNGAPAWTQVIGKALCYVIIYAPLTIYILHYIPMMFSLPHQGSPLQYLPFVFPMLLASAFLGLSLTPLMREREDAFLLIVFTSVVFLFLSGLTWPRYAMPDFWKWMGDLIPAMWGLEGFIRINTNGATLAENATPYHWLWALTAVYFITALAVFWWRRRKSAQVAAQRAATPDN